MSDGFSRLSAAVEKLQDKTEELSRYLKETEDKLIALAPGVATWLEDEEDLLALTESSAWQLGFAKTPDSDGWRLMVRKVGLSKSESGPARIHTKSQQQKTLLTAPRLVRVAAAEKLDKLFDALANRAERFASDIQRRLPTRRP